MPVIQGLFDNEVQTESKVVPNLFGEAIQTPETPSIQKPSLIQKNISVAKEFISEGFVKPWKTLYGGWQKSFANTADTLDFYADKIANALNIPETKDSIFEYLRDNWSAYGERLQKEGVSNKLMREIYSGLGEAGFEIPKLMALGPQGLVISGAAEGGKAGRAKGAIAGGIGGSLTKGIIKGTSALPTPIKLPVAFGFGAATTPGGLEEKVAGGAIWTGLSLGKSPTMKEFKATQAKYSPLIKGFNKIAPYETRERIYQNYFNLMQSIENIVEKARNLGAKIPPGFNPALRAREYLGMGQKVKSVLEDKTYKINPDGTYTYTGEGLKPILNDYDKKSPVKGRKVREKDLNDYLIARRTIEDLQRPKSEWTEKNIVTPEQVKKAQDTLDRLNKKYGITPEKQVPAIKPTVPTAPAEAPKEGGALPPAEAPPAKPPATTTIPYFEPTATRLYDYQKRILSMLVDSGNLSQEQFNIILTKNPHYVPFDRVIEGIEPTGGTPISKGRFTGARSPIKRIKGSELEIHNPIESMIKNTYRIMDVAERNIIARGIAKIGETLPEDISPVKVKMVPVANIEHTISVERMQETIFRPSQFKPKGNVIEYFENGKRKYMEVTPNLYQAMTGLNETSLSLLVKFMSMPAGTLRTGATITPEFMFRNPIRDQWTALMQTRLGFKPFVDSSKAVADILGKTDVYYDWLRSGGAYSGFVETSRKNMQKQLNILKGNTTLLQKLNIISKAQDISQLFEQATRLGVYKAGIKQGLTPVESGFQSREATIDFARRGAKTKDTNAIIAFFNAGIQGTDKMVRTAREDPMGVTMKGLATITIPSVITYILNRDDPEYKELPRWQKDLFWMVKIDDTWIRIPKPFAYGQVFGSLTERFLEYLDTQDPKAFTNLQKSLYDSVTPASGDPAGSLMATAVKPLIENSTNWSFFRQRPIVPEGKKRQLPAEQYGRYTTETAKYIGKLLKYSPSKIENIVQGWYGGAGMYALQTSDLAIKGVKRLTGQKITPKRPVELADIPLIKGFVARRPEGSQSESVNNFYDNMDKVIQVHETIRKYLQGKDKTIADQLKLKYPEYRAYQGINKTAKVLSDLSNYSDYIVNSNKPEVEKRKLLKEIDVRKTAIAQKANKAIENFKQTEKKNLVIPNLF